MLTLDQALDRIAAMFAPTGATETVSLDLARGRALAADVIAPVSVPPADNSAVDGWAVRFEDLPGTLRVATGRAAAGHPFGGTVAPGEALRIFTGAIIPDGADTVVMQEDAREQDGAVVLPATARVGANRRLAGEDMQAGDVVLRAGTRLGAGALGMLAALGIGRVATRARLKVAIFSNGDELTEAGANAAPGRIYDSNRPMMRAALTALGCNVEDLGILPDRRDTIDAALLHAASSADAIVSSAGMSVGEEDHVRAAIEARGALDFWSLAIKPGKPIAIGNVAGTPCFGLPGNPVAALLTLLLVVQPALQRLGGFTVTPPLRVPVTCGFDIRKKVGRREFVRVNLVRRADGAVVAMKYPRDGVGVLTSVVESDGVVELPEAIETFAAGQALPFLSWRALGLV
ncbi:gephyrin-like molybdotransferase Glp [Roseiterribacter gracilis]|uniref:Molybdopterin molybdenumtransferase n=1 Tax=Roseiterribacter gracilis TaxID=2812848 RepID=A0A8S8XE50_9PROT|nr:molybdopterin molybdenumtransferase MoeA [Rhodospirillales bacterium TMPK1]